MWQLGLPSGCPQVISEWRDRVYGKTQKRIEELKSRQDWVLTALELESFFFYVTVGGTIGSHGRLASSTREAVARVKERPITSVVTSSIDSSFLIELLT